MKIEKLLELLALHGGAIVSTASLDSMSIRQAQESERMYVDENSLGYVWEPNIERMPITEEEVDFFDKWYPISVPVPPELDKRIIEMINKMFAVCNGVKCTTPNCNVCKGEMY